MNDGEIKMALGELDRGVEVDPRRAGMIRSAMIDALHDASGEDVARVGHGDARTRRRWGIVIAVAASVTLLVGGLVVVSSSDDPVPTTSEVRRIGNYLVACVEFQAATRLGEESWIDVLSELERLGTDDAGYRAELADALDALAGEARATPFATELRQAASDSRDGIPPNELIAQLETIEQQSLRTAGLICLR